MKSAVKAGRHWCELENGIQIFGHSGIIRPAGDVIEGVVRPEHWRINTPDGRYGMPPYEVAAELYSRREINPIALNPLTAVSLYLDNGLHVIELERADEPDNFLIFTVVRNKLNFTLAISNGEGPSLITADRPIVPCPRPKQRFRHPEDVSAVRWVDI